MKALFDSITHLESNMAFHRERHTVLAGNIANIDTPGARALDLEQVKSQRPYTAAGTLARTDPGHLDGAPTSGANTASGAHKVIDDSGPAGPDGNAISLERELAKIDANRLRYVTSAELVSRRLALLRYAATDGVG